MNELLSFPGDPFMSRVLHLVVLVALEAALFTLAVRILAHYISSGNAGNRILGIVLGGGFFGIMAARFYALTFQHIFHADAIAVSAALIMGILLNLAVTNFIFSRPPGQ